MHGCDNVLLLEATFPHKRARASSRQCEIAECRCQLLLPIMCGVARPVQAELQQPAHVFIAWLVILGWQSNTYFPCWSVEVRSPHTTKAQTFLPRLPVTISERTVPSKYTKKSQNLEKTIKN